jgi:hypothetical protein
MIHQSLTDLAGEVIELVISPAKYHGGAMDKSQFNYARLSIGSAVHR